LVLDRAIAGDEAAFAEIVAMHHADLRRVAYVVCADREMADDAAQQAWQIAWRRISSVRDAAALRSWLVAIAANEARKLASRGRRRVVLEGRVRDVSRETDPAARLDSLDLVRALSRLSPDDRALLAMRYLAGLDSSEIARARGRSASGIRGRLARLLTSLREELEHG
ncbi:MAG TPA: sigma-70 family RNA polymerase sigma factor, partial [Pseudomonadales bacterium]|nr:sigma-70 family RNA polymerase sigma factor [Pseudomonadales bacterium]